MRNPNFTIMEEDPFAGFNMAAIPNDTDYNYEFIEDFSLWSTMETFMEYLLYISGCLSSIVIILTLMKVKNLQSPTHTYLLHYAIFSLIIYVTNVAFLIEYHILLGYFLVGSFMCMTYELEAASMMAMYFIALFLAIDFIASVLSGVWKQKFEKMQTFLLIGIYFITVLYYGIRVYGCFSFMYINSSLVNLFYGTIFTLFVILNIVIKLKVKPVEVEMYPLVIANFIVFSWSGLFFFYLFNNEFYYIFKDALAFIMELISFILKYFAYSGTTFILCYLGHVNSDFLEAYKIVFYRSKNVRDDEDNLLNQDV